MYLNTDHKGLNKFSGLDDPNFRHVSSIIQEMVGNARRVVKKNCESMKRGNCVKFAQV